MIFYQKRGTRGRFSCPKILIILLILSLFLFNETSAYIYTKEDNRDLSWTLNSYDLNKTLKGNNYSKFEINQITEYKKENDSLYLSRGSNIPAQFLKISTLNGKIEWSFQANTKWNENKTFLITRNQIILLFENEILIIDKNNGSIIDKINNQFLSLNKYIAAADDNYLFVSDYDKFWIYDLLSKKNIYTKSVKDDLKINSEFEIAGFNKSFVFLISKYKSVNIRLSLLDISKSIEIINRDFKTEISRISVNSYYNYIYIAMLDNKGKTMLSRNTLKDNKLIEEEFIEINTSHSDKIKNVKSIPPDINNNSDKNSIKLLVNDDHLLILAGLENNDDSIKGILGISSISVKDNPYEILWSKTLETIKLYPWKFDSIFISDDLIYINTPLMIPLIKKERYDPAYELKNNFILKMNNGNEIVPSSLAQRNVSINFGDSVISFPSMNSKHLIEINGIMYIDKTLNIYDDNVKIKELKPSFAQNLTFLNTPMQHKLRIYKDLFYVLSSFTDKANDQYMIRKIDPLNDLELKRINLKMGKESNDIVIEDYLIKNNYLIASLFYVNRINYNNPMYQIHCYDLFSGRLIWRYSYRGEKKLLRIIDDKIILLSNNIVCLQLSTGKEKWTFSYGTSYVNEIGFSQSNDVEIFLIDNKKLIFLDTNHGIIVDELYLSNYYSNLYNYYSFENNFHLNDDILIIKTSNYGYICASIKDRKLLWRSESFEFSDRYYFDSNYIYNIYSDYIEIYKTRSLELIKIIHCSQFDFSTIDTSDGTPAKNDIKVIGKNIYILCNKKGEFKKEKYLPPFYVLSFNPENIKDTMIFYAITTPVISKDKYIDFLSIESLKKPFLDPVVTINFKKTELWSYEIK